MTAFRRYGKIGLLWALSSLGVFLRDLGYTVTLITQMLFFLTPIFYPVEAIPPAFQAIVRGNPLASGVDALRGVIFAGTVGDPTSLLVSGGVGAVMMLVGYALICASGGTCSWLYSRSLRQQPTADPGVAEDGPIE